MKQDIRITAATSEGTIQVADGTLDFDNPQAALAFEMAVNADMKYRIHLSDPKPKAGKHAINAAIDKFAASLVRKAAATAKKRGHGENDWLEDDWADTLRRRIREHVEKGDPHDVGLYAAFAHHHGWTLATQDDDGIVLKMTPDRVENLEGIAGNITDMFPGDAAQHAHAGLTPAKVRSLLGYAEQLRIIAAELRPPYPGRTASADPRTATENTAAISDYFHCDTKRFTRFYDKHADALSGFPGIWKLCGDAGIALALAEEELDIEWGADAEWIDTVTVFAHRVMYKEHIPDRKDYNYKGGREDDGYLFDLAMFTIEQAVAGRLDDFWSSPEAQASGDAAADRQTNPTQKPINPFTKKPWSDAALAALQEPPKSAEDVTDVGAAIVFNSKGHVLLIHRRPDVPCAGYEGKWVLPGGKYEAGDFEISDTAVRELQQETGVEAMVSHDMPKLAKISADGKYRRWWFVCLPTVVPEPTVKEPEKHDDVGWFDPKALPANMSEDDRAMIQYVTGPVTPGHPYAVINDAPVSARELSLTLLAMVPMEASEEQLASLTPEQRWEAANWASAVHLNASDNDDVVVPPKPAFLDQFKISDV